jgi:hypothetical protein
MTVRNLRKSIVIACMLLCAALGFSSLYLFYYYHDGHLPNSPQPMIGRVYPSNNHGSIVYLNQSEHDLIVGLQFSILIPLLVGFVLNYKWRVFTDPLEGLSPEQRYKIFHGRNDQK